MIKRGFYDNENCHFAAIYKHQNSKLSYPSAENMLLPQGGIRLRFRKTLIHTAELTLSKFTLDQNQINIFILGVKGKLKNEALNFLLVVAFSRKRQYVIRLSFDKLFKPEKCELLDFLLKNSASPSYENCSIKSTS